MQRTTIPKELEQSILNLSTEKLQLATEIIKELSRTQIKEKEPTFITVNDPKYEEKNMIVMFNCQKNIFTAIQNQVKEITKQFEKNERISQPRKRVRFSTEEEEIEGQRIEELLNERNQNSEHLSLIPEKEKTSSETFLEEMEEEELLNPSLDEYSFGEMENSMGKAPAPIENNQDKNSSKKRSSETSTIEPKRTRSTLSFDSNMFVEFPKASPPEFCETLSHYCIQSSSLIV